MIEPVSSDNLDEVLPLIRRYQEFYNVQEISDSKNKAFFSTFGKESDFGCQFLFRQENAVAGFATVYFTYSSTITGKVAVLNDLYSDPAFRGQGIGKALITHCQEFAEQKGAVRLQWVTATSNETAQKLYDSLQTNKSTWHFYTLNTSGHL